MAIFETVAGTLGPTVGKLLLKNYLGDTAAELGKPLLDIAKTRITDGLEQRRAENIVNEIADQVVDELRAYFEQERVREVRAAAITDEIRNTLSHQKVLPLLLRNDIHPEKTLHAMRGARPLPVDALEGPEHQYYDTALRATVEMLARIIHRLPEFEPQQTAESLRRLRTLEDGMGEIRQDTRAILKQVMKIREEQVQSRLSVEERKESYERRYLGAVASRLDYVELFGADIRPETRQQLLSIAYIPLTVQQEATLNGGEPVGFESLLVQLVAGGKPLLLLGEAGSGKSTLFRWTAVTAARRMDEIPGKAASVMSMSEARKVLQTLASSDGRVASDLLAGIDFRRSRRGADLVDAAVRMGIAEGAFLGACFCTNSSYFAGQRWSTFSFAPTVRVSTNSLSM